MKISLGTVQFGSAYGSFNPHGQLPLDQVNEILSIAEDGGVVMLDTARAYGEAEKVLAVLRAPSRFEIVSKCPELSAESDPVTALQAAFESSMTVLGVPQLYGYLLHNADDILIPGVFSALKELRDSGRVKNIGVSGYDVQKVRSYCDHYALSVVQLPANILDPWFENVVFPDSVEVHVRSVFLQGFLLSKTTNLPDHLKKFSDVLLQFHDQATVQGLTPIQAALLPLLACSKITKIIVGTDAPCQFSEILQTEKFLRDRSSPVFGPYKGLSPDLTDPRKWAKKQ
jgi:aryl-alcohol dehydrogenase-like predicted oxidoreductase